MPAAATAAIADTSMGHVHTDPELVSAFATRVAQPGTDALYLTWHNGAAGWDSLEDAARSGRPFCVLPRWDLLVIDCDKGTRAHDLWAIGDELRHLGLQPVIVESGRPGHLHLFCLITDPDLACRYRTRTKALDLDARVGQRIRPPLAPHRLGLPVRLLVPADAAEALTALTPPKSKARELTTRMNTLLRDGNYLDSGYKSRSEAIQALALAACNAEWSEDGFFAALMDSRNRAGDKIRDRRDARQYVARSWAQAQWKEAASPAITDRPGAQQRVVAIGHAVAAYRWAGRSGTTDQLVFEALLALAHAVGKLTLHADVRTLATATGFTAPTVSRSLRRLRHARWLVLARGAQWKSAEAAIWTLRTPPRACTPRNTPISGNASFTERPAQSVMCTPRNTPISPTGGCMESVALGTSAVGREGIGDLWRRDGLGPARFRVWRLLDAESVRRARELAAALCRGPRIVQRHLTVLERYGLAVRDRAGWRRGEAIPEDVAASLGVLGQWQRQHGRHQRDRERYRSVLDEAELRMQGHPAAFWSLHTHHGAQQTANGHTDY